MSTLVINGRPFAAGLYWLERAGPAATARAARRFARPWCVHRAGQTGYAGGTEGDTPEGLPALALALTELIESEFWMALVADDAAIGNSTDTGDTGRYALIKVRDGAVLADGDEVFTNRDAAVEAFTRARALGWDLYATPGLLAGGADRDVTDLDVSSLTAGTGECAPPRAVYENWARPPGAGPAVASRHCRCVDRLAPARCGPGLDRRTGTRGRRRPVNRPGSSGRGR